MTESYQIPKDKARVTLHPPEANTEVFLSRDARRHDGHETISDLVNDPEPFLPTHPTSGGVVLFRKTHISWILIHDPLETEESFFETSGYAHRYPVQLAFEDGGELEGSLVVVASAGASRVSDIVNTGEGWLHFEDEKNHYLVNLSRIARIALSPRTTD